MTIDTNLIYNISELYFECSYFKNIVWYNKTLVIPFINIGITNDAVTPNEVKYIDYSLLIVEEVNRLCTWVKNQMDFNGEWYQVIVSDSESETDIIYIGGLNLNKKSIFNELKISCQKAYLKIFSNSKSSVDYFIPIDTPNYQKNMNDSEIDFFFSRASAMYPNGVILF